MSAPPPPPRHPGRIAPSKSTTASQNALPSSGFSLFSSSGPSTTASSTALDNGGENATWRTGWKEKGKGWGNVAYKKGFQISDKLGGTVNGWAEHFGSERFWPTTGDFPAEIDKAARILTAFTVDGLETKETVETDKKGKPKKQRKVLRKIPPEVIRDAAGLAIYTSMRSGIAPFGGAGGTGLVVAKLPDGTWSPPAGFMPNNLGAGLVLGVDIYDCVLVIRTPEALEKFFTHKATLGTDIGVVAGPLGAGAAAETGVERSVCYSYVRSRGLYAGVQLVGQLFIDRVDENAAQYHWPGVKAGDILQGKVRMPREAAPLIKALEEAESGAAQKKKGEGLDVVVPEGVNDLVLEEGEVLKLPPTPTQVSDSEGDSDPETQKVHYEPGHGPHEATSSSANPPPLPPRLPPRRNGTQPPEYQEHEHIGGLGLQPVSKTEWKEQHTDNLGAQDREQVTEIIRQGHDQEEVQLSASSHSPNAQELTHEVERDSLR